MRPFLPTVLLLAVLAGCGGDDGDDREAPAERGPTPTKQEFIAKADKVCRDLERRSRRLGRRPPRSPEELVRLARRTTRLHREGLRRLEAIGLPAEGADRRGARRFVDSIRAISRPIEALERAAKQVDSAVEARSREKVQAAVLNLQEALINAQQADNKSHRIARRYGLEDCAREHDGEEPGKPGRRREPS